MVNLYFSVNNNCVLLRYVGGWPENADYLPPGNPSVIDCTNEFPKTHNSSRYLCLMVWDSHGMIFIAFLNLLEV